MIGSVAMSVCVVLSMFVDREPVDLILVAGDVHAAAPGDAATISSPYSDFVVDQPSVLLRVAIDGMDLNGGWKPAAPVDGTFGVEMGMAHALAGYDPDRTFGIMRYAVSNGTLSCDWAEDVCGSAARASLFAKVDAWRAELGVDSRVAGVVWIHGEHDATSEAAADAYGSGLGSLATAMRVAFDDEALPIVVAVPMTDGAWAPEVRGAADEVASGDAHMASVSLAASPRDAGNILTNEGLVGAGLTLADAMLAQDPLDLAGTLIMCPHDLVIDGSIDISDLLYVFGTWGPCSACRFDFTLDGVIDVDDLLHLLGMWGTQAGDVTGDGDTGVDDMLAVIGVWGPCDP